MGRRLFVRLAPRLIGLIPSNLFERDCGEVALNLPVLAPAEGRIRVAKYDVAIIGSGPGGYVAAIRAGPACTLAAFPPRCCFTTRKSTINSKTARNWGLKSAA